MQYKAKNTGFSIKFRVIFRTKIRKNRIVSPGHTSNIFIWEFLWSLGYTYCNKKIWVSYSGIFFSISVLFGVPCVLYPKANCFPSNVKRSMTTVFVRKTIVNWKHSYEAYWKSHQKCFKFTEPFSIQKSFQNMEISGFLSHLQQTPSDCWRYLYFSSKYPH